MYPSPPQQKDEGSAKWRKRGKESSVVLCQVDNTRVLVCTKLFFTTIVRGPRAPTEFRVVEEIITTRNTSVVISTTPTSRSSPKTIPTIVATTGNTSVVISTTPTSRSSPKTIPTIVATTCRKITELVLLHKVIQKLEGCGCHSSRRTDTSAPQRNLSIITWPSKALRALDASSADGTSIL
ncbi:hypothetical protein H5410_006756 [Solanum commersonii]|uniref:Uncharacterized protein n=1 Tax=Solanum commersonii TaxID=4109 RepID=A0A9J6ABF5_SOLCO|nr:hypothetical protein H5410_006756 [Solanum commersonii]